LRLGSAVIHHVANPQVDAGVNEGLASAIDFAPEQLGDGLVYCHGFLHVSLQRRDAYLL
jgi:hypothetical protein